MDAVKGDGVAVCMTVSKGGDDRRCYLDDGEFEAVCAGGREEGLDGVNFVLSVHDGADGVGRCG
jgi:hypothetical protein